MTIWPDYRDCIIALFLHFGWVYFRIDLFLFQKFCSSKFINTGCTFAHLSKHIWSYFFLLTIWFNHNFPFSSVIISVDFADRFIELLLNVLADLNVKFSQVVLFRQHECQRNSQIRVFRYFWYQRKLYRILKVINYLPQFQTVPSSSLCTPSQKFHLLYRIYCIRSKPYFIRSPKY